MMRYARLWPPPWCRVVIRPWLLRPPFLGSGRTRDFSGVVRVISAKSATDEPRRPGVVGLYLRIAMFSQSYSARSGDRTSEDVDAVAGGEADDGALGVLALADAARRTTRLALAVERVDGGDLDVEHLLDRDLDLGLVGVRVHDEGVLVVVEQAVALLADDRRDQHVAVVLVQGAHSPSSSAAAFLAGAFFAAAFLAGLSSSAAAFLAGAFLAAAFLAGFSPLSSPASAGALSSVS